MLATGEITAQQYRWAVRQPLGLKPGQIYTRIRQPYFFSYVIDQLESVYGANTVREGGLRVYTTIEPRLQAEANQAIRETLNEHDDPAAAIVSVVARDRRDPRDDRGRPRATGATSSTWPRSRPARPARRSRPFVLAAAIEQGMDPDTTYYTSAPFTCTTGPWCAADYAAGKPWTVHTYEHTYAGSISVTEATLLSDNTVYAQLTLDVGPGQRLASWRSGLGVDLTPEAGRLDRARLALGLAARHGRRLRDVRRRRHLRQTDGDPQGGPARRQGRHDALGQAARRRACSRRASRGRSTRSWRENALYGTGAGSGDGIHPNAGKTGTTENHADAWFDGYTRDLSTVVWMGYPSGEIPMLDVHGEAVAGATFPVPIWHLFMAAAEKGRPALPFLTPAAYPVYRPFKHELLGLPRHPAAAGHDDDDHDDEDRARLDNGDHPVDAWTGCAAAEPATTLTARRAPSIVQQGWARLLTIAEALELVLARAVPLEAEEVALDAAAGRVLAAPALAAVDLPSVRRLGDGRVRPARGGYARDAAGRRPGSPPAGRRARARRR